MAQGSGDCGVMVMRLRRVGMPVAAQWMDVCCAKAVRLWRGGAVSQTGRLKKGGFVVGEKQKTGAASVLPAPGLCVSHVREKCQFVLQTGSFHWRVASVALALWLSYVPLKLSISTYVGVLR